MVGTGGHKEPVCCYGTSSKLVRIGKSQKFVQIPSCDTKLYYSMKMELEKNYRKEWTRERTDSKKKNSETGHRAI